MYLRPHSRRVFASKLRAAGKSTAQRSRAVVIVTARFEEEPDDEHPHASTVYIAL